MKDDEIRHGIDDEGKENAEKGGRARRSRKMRTTP